MDIKEVHKKLLNLMIELDKICLEHNISYTLHGGSLLGAIREHGFISWDDDVDIAMSREEFNKLEETLKNDDTFYVYGDIKKQFGLIFLFVIILGGHMKGRKSYWA